MYHVWIEYNQGAGYARQETYISQRGGQKPAAWEAVSTAGYWGRRLAEGADYFAKECLHPDTCPVCKAHEEGGYGR